MHRYRPRRYGYLIQIATALKDLNRRTEHLLKAQDQQNALLSQIVTGLAGIRADIADLKNQPTAPEPPPEPEPEPSDQP